MADDRSVARAAPTDPAGERNFRRALAVLLGIAALVRLAHWLAVRELPFVATLALDAAEYDRWARALAAGDWLGSEPFFQAPLYPYALGLLYALAGRSLDAVYLAQIALGVAGLLVTALVARRLLGDRHALAAAALGALYAPLVFHEVQLAKEGPAVAAAAALLFALARAREAPGKARWILAGALLGVLALLRENALLLAPFLAPLALVRVEVRDAGSSAGRRLDARHSAGRVALFLLGLALPLVPVAARNAALGGGLLATTSQGGVNLWIGNNPDADGTYRPLVPGKQIPALERSEARRLAETALGRPLRAAEVSRYWRGRTLDWIAAEPAAFLRLAARKLALYLSPYEWPDVVDYAWMRERSAPLRTAFVEWGALLALAVAGLALAKRRERAALAPIVLFELGWLVATVVFFLFSRYRLPAVPGLLVLGSIPLVAVAERWRAGRRTLAAAGAAAVVLAVAATRLAAPPPRLDLVHFNLGRLAQEAGRLEEATREYRLALTAAPEMFEAAMNLGVLAGRAGRYDEAAAWLAKATALEPGSDDAWANLGAAWLARGELDAAREALVRALGLNPEHVAARANLDRLVRRSPGGGGAEER